MILSASIGAVSSTVPVTVVVENYDEALALIQIMYSLKNLQQARDTPSED